MIRFKEEESFMRTDFQHVLVQEDDGILTLTMNRPAVLNAINDLMLQELNEVVDAASVDERVRYVVLAGAGRGFGAGQDLTEFANRPPEQTVQISEHLQKYHHLVSTLHTMPRPVIAVLHGVVTGISLNIALACDLRIAAEDARLSEAFARIGLVPDGGGAYFLSRLVGPGKAMELALLTDEISGTEAERLGLVNISVPAAELAQRALALAQRLAHGPTHTYGLIKELFYTTQESDLHTVFQIEGRLQDAAFATADHREGVQAFLQKRPPRYSGK
jgi:2-(1,2-epoxy-1,2-dihydrophenyl)acetyl-CoA isomerase